MASTCSQHTSIHRAEAWKRWEASGLTLAIPTPVLNALIDAWERELALRAAVRAFVTAPEDGLDRLLAFNALVKELAR